MLNLNSTTLVGRSTKEAELKEVKSSKVCSFRIVQNERVKKKDGSYEDKPMFIDVEAWGPRAEYAAKYIKKGSVVLVQGKLEQDEWEKDGEKRQKHKIYALNLQVERVPGEGGEKEDADEKPKTSKKPSGKQSVPQNDDDSDNLPF